jgi:hypothetical protein
MNIKDLNTRELKKQFQATQCHMSYHNKNCAGGNFGMVICGVFGKDWGLIGYYDDNGEIYEFKFGYIFGKKWEIEANDFFELQLKISLWIQNAVKSA